MKRDVSDSGGLAENQHHVHIKEWDTGDWYEVEVDGNRFPLCSGHGIYITDLYKLLPLLGVRLTRERVTEEEEALP